MCIAFNSNRVVAFGIYQLLGAFEYELYIGFCFLVFSLLYHFHNKISYSIGAITHRVPDSRSDLRILDPFLSNPSTIISRDKALVFNFEGNEVRGTTAEIAPIQDIKSLFTIKALLHDPLEENVNPLVEELPRWLPRDSQTYGKEFPLGKMILMQIKKMIMQCNGSFEF